MFGTWPAKDAQQWNLVLTGARLMEKINKTEKIICYSLGWIQPLAFFSYRQHIKSVEYYVQSLKTQVLVYEPELLVGEKMTYLFKPKKIETKPDGRRYAVSGKISVEVDAQTSLDMMEVTGYLIKEGSMLLLLKEKP